MTTLAFVDLLLRINWFVLILLFYRNEYWVSCAIIGVVMILSIILNLCIWRSFFTSKYDYFNDPYFKQYLAKYPKTGRISIVLSYIFTFQAIRITYSRLLGKKQFMARFAKRRTFFRLIGRLSILEIFALYLPAMTGNILSLFYIPKGEQLFYVDIDSLILLSYSIILISVVLSQREKVLGGASELFKLTDLLSCKVPEEELIEEEAVVVAGDNTKQ